MRCRKRLFSTGTSNRNSQKTQKIDFIAIDNIEKQKHTLVELLDKNQVYVHFSEIDDENFQVNEKDKALNRKFYSE